MQETGYYQHLRKMENEDFESLENIILASDYLVQNVIDEIENEDFYVPITFRKKIHDEIETSKVLTKSIF